MIKVIPKTLALDYGTKRIGLAISQGTLAEPLEVILNQADTLEKIKNICDQQRVSQILVGISEGEMAEKTKEFIMHLRQVVKLQVITTDETLSSYQVEQMLKHRGIKKTKRTGPIDHYAAAVFLQDWIEQQ